jgi:carboxypeptidase Q
MKPARMLLVCGLLLSISIAAQVTERVDLAAIDRIKEEASQRSQVMEVAANLTKGGPRLTNTPNLKIVAEYALKQLVAWKMAEVHYETWTFGNGWTNDRFTMKVVSDPGMTFLAYPKAWTPGTTGPVRAEVVEGMIQSESDFTRLRGKLRGKFVMILPAPSSRTAPSVVKRFTDTELAALATQPDPIVALQAQQAAAIAAQRATTVPASPPATAGTTSQAAARGGQPPAPPQLPPSSAEPAATGFFSWVENALSAPAVTDPTARVAPAGTPAPVSTRLTRDRVTAFYMEEGVAAMIEPGGNQGDTVFVVPATGETDPWKSKDALKPKVPPQVFVAGEQYGRLLKMIDQKKPVILEMDIKNTFYTQDRNALNVIADIKGTDKADELVMLGAHLDSWHVGSGATDNAAGVAVVMEAMRILKTLGLPMRRTVRLGLWTGEEEGMLGSRAYIGKAFVNTLIQETRPDHAKLSAYFNVDNGTGAIRGVYMQGNTAIAPIFEQWMSPFKSMGMTTLAPRSVTGTDHYAFDNAGLPAFQFIQDPIEYDTRTHHTNLDVYNRLVKDDLMKNAAIVAAFVYMTANREELLPRKPLPRNVRPAGSTIP